jgi:hypothetical protein
MALSLRRRWWSGPCFSVSAVCGQALWTEMNREFERKNSGRILGGVAGLRKIYVGRCRRGASADLPAENRWAEKMLLGGAVAPDSSGLPQNQITTWLARTPFSWNTRPASGAFESLSPPVVQQREQSAIEASTVPFYRRYLKEGTLFVLHGHTCPGVVCTATPVARKLKLPDQKIHGAPSESEGFV